MSVLSESMENDKKTMKASFRKRVDEALAFKAARKAEARIEEMTCSNTWNKIGHVIANHLALQAHG